MSSQRNSSAEIIRRASRARNGRKFIRLWRGSTIDTENDHSAADLALCRLLAFWCGPRHNRIGNLFRQSRLYRSKWDEAHYSDGRTYGDATIEKAILCQGDTIQLGTADEKTTSPVIRSITLLAVSVTTS